VPYSLRVSGGEIAQFRLTGFPDRSWIRNELRGTICDVLNDRTTVNRGYFERVAVQQILRENGRSGDYSKEVFSLLILELWHRAFVDSAVRSSSVPA
jgi:asparagine synthase (glutamine-hydrolysing)